MVEVFHRVSLANGGSDDGAPELHPHPGYGVALAVDSNGDTIDAVYHGDARRSAPSVTVTS